ncbi:MAG: hypothetical protein L0H96_25820 [Humibacillus sp.]|nr:hypothetical protein [Humibacillus sp.]
MRRRSVDVPLEHLDALEAAVEHDGVSVPTRLAALVQLWVDDVDCRRQVAVIGQEIEAGKLLRKQAAAAIAQQHRWPARGSDTSS